MKEISISKGFKAIIDDEDYFKIVQYNWHYSNGYARRGLSWSRNSGLKRQYKPMQNEILECPIGLEIDHINHNRLDNRKSNLRIATRSQNIINRKSYNITRNIRKESKYEAYYCYLTVNKKTITIGSFKTPHQASLAYDLWAKDIYGEFAITNNKIVSYG